MRLDERSSRRALALALASVAAGALPILAAALDAPPRPALLPPGELRALACGRPPRERVLLGERVPIDRADREVWALLPGFGPKTVDAVASEAPRSFEALDGVRGVGPLRLAVARRHLTDPSPTPGPPCR